MSLTEEVSVAISENPQQEAGLLMSEETKSGHCLQYKGVMEGAEVAFFFNIDKGFFLCEMLFDGKPAKMTGTMKRKEEAEGVYLCSPLWGVIPASNMGEKWEDTSGEEIKEFNLSSNELDFEGTKLIKVIELPSS
mmetsp:Transcript_33735/g.35033  ORF Transcript_33735/g.35033 Transcript_33735/m.35033 type:complete len:135 (+) Transcript_33735:16-420(+)